MDLLQLRYFQTLARMEHMTKAAEQLHIAQPSLSKTISRLEKSLGVPLFDRQGKQIRLNPFGKAFLCRVNRVFTELEEANRELLDMAGLENGVVHLGTTTTRLLPDLISAFLSQYPHVNIRLLQFPTKEIQHHLVNGEINFCISSPPLHQPGICCNPLLTEDIYLAVPTKHPLANRDQINLCEVASDKFISLTADYALRDLTIEFCNRAGFIPNIAFECNDAEVIFDMVKLGLGTAFIPAHWWKENNSNLPVKLKIREPVCERVIGLNWVETRYLSTAAQTFRTFATDYFDS
ncbi:LysR family transcriptional regulator [Bacillus salipaludis]|uniref:LysR family transcriptional regulator n=1 Tax=Bacillus salipaludis TaxID=2547811 RepID=A0A4R5VMH0_9BACI|nr:LysR family transcriptional regulator [Bacillus salipaludis]MDQ6596590.1 LysR family transcriptional regulator [Bacillus salipaludis]TDK58496.1 LysR family transcriptional regulator [Bacillus salipaludis]